MSTLEEKKTIEETFPVGKVIRAFRTTGVLQWDIGRIIKYERHSKTDELLGVIVKFFSDGGTIDYPVDVLTPLGEDSFIVDVAKEDVIRELWPVGVPVMIKQVGQSWEVATVDDHTIYGVRLVTNRGTTAVPWEDFTDDARCQWVRRLGRAK